MFTFLDLLIIVSMALIAGSLLSVALMFLVKNRKVQHICYYIAIALNLYIASVGIRINWPGFFGQAALAAVLALLSIGTLVLKCTKKDDERMFLFARITAAAALVIGTINALLV